MASSHVHSVHQGDGLYHHLFNFMFLTVPEIETIALALSGKPIPVEKEAIKDNLKNHIVRMHDAAMSKNAENAENAENTENTENVENIENAKEIVTEALPDVKPKLKSKPKSKPKPKS